MPNVETSLADEIMAVMESRPRGGGRCWTCDNLSPELQAEIRKARDKGATYTAIHAALETSPRFGLGKGKVSFSSLRQHLLGGHGK